MQPNSENQGYGPAGELEPNATSESAHTSSALSTFLIGFGSILLLFTIVRILGKVRRRAQSPREDPREVIARHRAQAQSAREPLDNVMAEANELAVRLAKVLDAKATRLEILIEQADERIATLGAIQPPQTPAAAPMHAPDGASASTLERQVLELAERGCDSDQIARRTGRSVGEVELILALRR